MKTTLNIAEPVMIRLKEEAARRGKTMSELVESALRLFLKSEDVHEAPDLSPLPSFASGGHLVNIDDRDELQRRMDGR